MVQQKTLTAACYIRLSREDGDRAESLSVENQRLLLSNYCNGLGEYEKILYFVDDGYTGTNFERPGFRRMEKLIEQGEIQCVVVKDLSRLGRESSMTTYYVQKYFPQKRVRFIAIDDGVDKVFGDIDSSNDINIELKNVLNGFYPKDIGRKVRSTFQAKKKDGQFIGAFACYGYAKDPADHNHLVIDETAAEVVRRIYALYLDGEGQNTIAKILNDEGIPCPSVYKRQCGMNYQNSNRLDSTVYWTYSTIHKILTRQQYTGAVVQNQSFRNICEKKAYALPREKWIVVQGMHEAIVDDETFEKVQKLLKNNTRPTRLDRNVHMFAGFVKCGDCGRAMVKVKRGGKGVFQCGSYNRYGKSFCTAHMIEEDTLEAIVRDDFNHILRSVKRLRILIDEECSRQSGGQAFDEAKLRAEIQRIAAKKERLYEDMLDGIISKDEYLRFKEKFEGQIADIQTRLQRHEMMRQENEQRDEWIQRLLDVGCIDRLDRQMIVEMVDQIYIYDDYRIRIIYNFSDDLEDLL